MVHCNPDEQEGMRLRRLGRRCAPVTMAILVACHQRRCGRVVGNDGGGVGGVVGACGGALAAAGAKVPFSLHAITITPLAQIIIACQWIITSFPLLSA